MKTRLRGLIRRWLLNLLRDDIELIVNSELLSSDCCCSATSHRYS